MTFLDPFRQTHIAGDTRNPLAGQSDAELAALIARFNLDLTVADPSHGLQRLRPRCLGLGNHPPTQRRGPGTAADQTPRPTRNRRQFHPGTNRPRRAPCLHVGRLSGLCRLLAADAGGGRLPALPPQPAGRTRPHPQPPAGIPAPGSATGDGIRDRRGPDRPPRAIAAPHLHVLDRACRRPLACGAADRLAGGSIMPRGIPCLQPAYLARLRQTLGRRFLSVSAKSAFICVLFLAEIPPGKNSSPCCSSSSRPMGCNPTD